MLPDHSIDPLVTVVVPVHGNSPWLVEALGSIAIQTFSNFECIVVLDRPSREARDRAFLFQETDVRFRVLASKVPGLASALNVGLRAAKGQLIARMDADDVMVETRLERQAQAFFTDSKLGVLGTQAVFIDEVGNKVGRTNLPLRLKEISKLLPWTNPMVHPSLMFRSSAKFNFHYDARLETGEDYELLFRANRSGIRMRNLVEPLLLYRLSGGQMTANKLRQRNFQIAMSDYIAQECFEGDSRFIQVRNAVHNFYFNHNYFELLLIFLRYPAPGLNLFMLWLRYRVFLKLARFFYVVVVQVRHLKSRINQP
jgi:glycosyltransferase involved in cell wall biosynthesis